MVKELLLEAQILREYSSTAAPARPNIGFLHTPHEKSKIECLSQVNFEHKDDIFKALFLNSRGVLEKI